jgi:uncharacterized protein (TIGR02996 family)
MMAAMDHRTFERAVLESPDDDRPRLVYADWLDEQGDPRGEFIRVQVELEALADGDPNRAALKWREDDLLAEHRAQWLGRFRDRLLDELPALAGATGWEFRRGFVEQADLPARTFLAHADRLGRVAPVRHVRLAEALPYIDDLADSPLLERLLTLDLSGNRLADAGVTLLLRSRRLHRLTALDLSACDCSPPALRQLPFTPLGSLRALNLASNPAVGDATLQALAEATWLSRLRDLNLTGTGVGAAGLQAFERADRFLHSLHRLNLSYNLLGPDGTDRLAGAPALARLTELRLDSCRLRKAGLHALLRSPWLTGLTRLDLADNGLRDGGASMLACSRRLARLARLGLRGNGIGPAGAVELAGAPFLGRLAVLDLTQNPLGPEGAAALAGSSTLTGLRELVLREAGLGDDGVRVLAGSEVAAGLTALSLGNNGLGDDAAEALAGPSEWRGLRELDLRGNRIGPTGARALAASPGLEGLRVLDLSRNRVGPEAVAALRGRFGRGVTV